MTLPGNEPPIRWRGVLCLLAIVLARIVVQP